ncbi:hypothetical protein PHLCEN_2v11891 [Hermanssonia centrifuga]|uniref:Uncharacterized protein n=1 Tax=Hermanssonia centrifuga TaxID=98765 RepID=A0A2R6NIV8_9APHY|nr:hypothetical protein PHLCEN_2v11891 [Hermanssonia centrifuga]
MCKLDGWIDEGVIKWHGESSSKSKRYRHARKRDGDRKSCISFDNSGINFEANEEKEETEANVCDEGQIGLRILGEDVLLEPGNTTESGWTWEINELESDDRR